MKKIIVVAAVLVAVVGLSVGLIVVSSGEGVGDAGREFLSVPQVYDTTGGQEMQPRWGDREGAEDGARAR